MTYKYGNLSDQQYAGYVKELHGTIHLLLIYAEKNRPILDTHFASVQRKINAANELLGYPDNMNRLISKIEEARMLDVQSDFSLFRKLVLDAHSLLDEILPEVQA